MRNVCENCARLGLDARLLTAVGDDPFGRLIVDSCREAGVGISHLVTVPGAASSVYVSLLDETGDMAVACSDMNILKRLSPADIDAAAPFLTGAACACIDGNPTPEVIAHTARLLQKAGVPLFFDPVSTAHARKFRGLTGLFHTSKPNRLELEVLSGRPAGDDDALAAAAQVLMDQGLRRVFVTLGPDGVYYRDAEGVSRFYRPPPLLPGELKNATGGGDAFLAGLISSWFEALPLEQTLQRAAAAARLTVRCEDTVFADLSLLRINQLLGGLPN